MNYIYKFLVDGKKLSCLNCSDAPSGNAGVLRCEFEIIDNCSVQSWYCSFRKAGKVRNVEIVDGVCDFSDDMLTREGKLFIGVFGCNFVNGIGRRLLSTNFVKIDIERGAYQEALGKVAPSPWEKCMILAMNNEADIRNLTARCEDGLFDGAIDEEQVLNGFYDDGMSRCIFNGWESILVAKNVKGVTEQTVYCGDGSIYGRRITDWFDGGLPEFKRKSARENDVVTLDARLRVAEQEMADVAESVAANVIECEASGESITLYDSAELPLKSLRVLGKTKQVKTEGKNIIPFPAFKEANGNNGMNYVPGHTKKINGVTFIVNDDGSITFNGTASMKTTFTMVYNYNKNPYMQLTPGRTYRITSNYNYPEASGTTFNANMLIRQYKADGTYVDKYLMNSVMARTHTIDEEYVSAYLYTCQLIVAAGYTANNVTIYVMLEEGDTASPYEPYTGGKPSPSPEWKQPLKTAVVAEEFIQLEVSNEAKERIQSVILSPFNGLWGVPVSSGGNYTDSDGQQWVCNELDLVRGVYIERVVHETIGTLPTVYTAGTTAEGKTIYGGYYNTTGIAEGAGLCTVASYVDNNRFGLSGNAEMSVFNTGADLFEVAFSYATTDEDSFRNIFEGQEIILLKEAPTETPFSAAVLAQCKTLHSYNPTTNIANDKGAQMVVEYVADTKTYIDNKFAALEAAVISLGGNV